MIFILTDFGCHWLLFILAIKSEPFHAEHIVGGAVSLDIVSAMCAKHVK